MTEDEFSELYDKHIDSVYILCFSYMKNKHDAEDAVQETFIKLLKSKKKFSSEEHIKAWLIVTASNICKNMLKNWYSKHENIDDYPEIPDNSSEKQSELQKIILNLPEKYKIPLYLYYYEGYKVKEISSILEKKEATVKTLLSRGRELVKKKLQRSDDLCLK